LDYSYADIRRKAEELGLPVNTGEYFRVTITLDDGDTAVAPGSTKKVFTGPGKVQYTWWTDGGVDAEVLEGTALRRKQVD